MIETIVRCSICEMEIYRSINEEKKCDLQYFTIKEAESKYFNGSFLSRIVDKIYCSPECIIIDLKEIKISWPLEEDIKNALQYKIKSLRKTLFDLENKDKKKIEKHRKEKVVEIIKKEAEEKIKEVEKETV